MPCKLLLLFLTILQILEESACSSASPPPSHLLGSPCDVGNEDSCHPADIYFCSNSQRNTDFGVGDGDDGGGGKCECRAPFVEDSSRHLCLPKATRLGDPCQIHEQCRANLGFGSDCEGTCTCTSDGYTESREKTKCLPIRHHLGDECQEEEQCHVKQQQGGSGREVIADCANNKCVCWPSPSECYHKVERVGDLCRYDADCQVKLGQESACTRMKERYSSKSWKCTCTNGTTPIDNFSKCGHGPVAIGSACDSSTVCVGRPHSECTVSGICSCGRGYVPRKYLDECLPIVNRLGGPCSESHQCQSGVPGGHSECVENSSGVKACLCNKDAVDGPGSHKCYKKPTAFYLWTHPKCETHIECVASFGSSVCIEGHCECLPGTEFSGERAQCWFPEWLQKTTNN